MAVLYYECIIQNMSELLTLFAGPIELSLSETITTFILLIIFPVTLILLITRLFVKKKWLTFLLIALGVINACNFIYLQIKGKPQPPELIDFSQAVD